MSKYQIPHLAYLQNMILTTWHQGKTIIYLRVSDIYSNVNCNNVVNFYSFVSAH